MISVIIPAYNEVHCIGTTVSEIARYFARKPYDFEIIVSADGDDGTRELVQKLAEREPRLTVMGQRERRGKGYGIRRAIRVAKGQIIGFVDADNKTPITDFDKFEPHFVQGCQVVIGSRGLHDSRVERPQPLYRRLGSKVFGVVMHTMVGLEGIIDTQCGFKFFSRGAAIDIFSRQRIDGYMFDVEILVMAESAGYRIAQVPVRWSDDGDSRLQLVRGSVRNLADLCRIRFARNRGRTSPELVTSDNALVTVFLSKTGETPDAMEIGRQGGEVAER